MKVKALALVTLMVVCVLIIGACTTTVTPKTVRDTVPSFDGTNQNSGFIGFGPNGTGYITPHGRDRYNGYIAIYGKKFIPPLVVDAGLTFISVSNIWAIDPEHMVKYGQMNRWRKAGRQ